MGTQTSGYVYVATSEGLAQSYVGVSRSLLDMEWIAKFGVDSSGLRAMQMLHWPKLVRTVFQRCQKISGEV